MSVKSILFVCSANCCRSVMAEALMKAALAKKGITDIDVFSRGTGALFGRRPFAAVQEVLGEWKIDVTQHGARPIEKGDVQKADLILVAEDSHKRFIDERFLKSEQKTHLLKQYAGDAPDPTGSWNVPDPVGLTPETCRACRDELKQTIDRLVAKLWPQ